MQRSRSAWKDYVKHFHNAQDLEFSKITCRFWRASDDSEARNASSLISKMHSDESAELPNAARPNVTESEENGATNVPSTTSESGPSTLS